jgi:hypothetical protein
MPYENTMVACAEKHKEHINVRCLQKAEFFKFKPGGTQSYN